MEKLNKETLQELLERTSSPAVTIYIPMHASAAPPHITENQIRFKNLLHKAAEEVRSQTGNNNLAATLENKASELHDSLHFWESRTPGLLVCATADYVKLFDLPIDTEEYVSVGDNFYLAPVIGLLNDQREYYLLSITQHDPQLYKSTMYGLEPTGIKLPANSKDALNIDEENRKTENQGTATGSSMKTSGFNGRGGARNPEEQDRLRFFREVDKIIYNRTGRDLPLLLAGTDSIVAEYRAISKYPQILEGVIPGNHSNDDLATLFESAKTIIWQELIMPEHQAAVNEYQSISGANPEKVAHTNKTIAEAAAQGRVDKLLARMCQYTADTVRDKAGAVPRISFPDLEVSKKLNDIALSVWQARGTVLNLMPNEMPNGALMVARLRY